MRAVHQFVPRLEPGAVGAHALEARRILRAMGHPSEIYADGADAAWEAEAHPYQGYGRQSRPGDVLIYQAAVGSVVADYLLERREPLIVNYHNVTPARFFRPWDHGVVHAVTVGVRQIRRLAARATAGIAVSAYNERELRDAGYRRTSVAPVLFDVGAMRNATDEEALRRLTVAKQAGGADLLFVGRVAPNKAHHDLVKAFAIYRRAYDPAARLHLVGGSATPSYSTALEQFVAALGLQDAVRLAGSVSVGELAAHYRAADAFVCLSEHEGFCVPLVEAMANDVPIVAFAAAAVPETLAGTGLLLDAKDPVTVAAALHRVVADDSLRQRLVAGGRARLDDLSLDRLEQQFRAAVGDVLARLEEDGRAVKVAYVMHRYGAEVRGGAEQAVRSLAEHLAAATSWTVEVFTTGARDGTDWVDQYPEGTTNVGGVTVHRVHSRAPRGAGFDALSSIVLPRPEAASLADQERWVDEQGPLAPELLDAVGDAAADLVVFCPYLYYPTVRGVPRFADRAVVHPAAHDEAPLRLLAVRPVFTAARALAFFSEVERALVARRFPVAATPQAVVGLGVDGGTGDEAAFRALAGVGDRPYVLCLGRVDEGKGTTLLARFFAAYKERHPGDLALVLVGPLIDPPPPHGDVFVTGPVDEDAKWGALAGAELLVSPSPNESFSIVLMEAWLAGLPVVVNGRCAVTVDHCRRSGGGLWFDGYASFEAVLDRLAGDERCRAALASAGRRYVDREYRWPVVIGRYARFLEAVAEGSS